MEKALEGKQLSSIPKELNEPLQKLWSERPTPLLVRLELRLGSAVAYQRALQMILDPKEKDHDRTSVIETIGQVGKPGCISALEKVFSDSKSNVLRLAALSALETFPDARVSDFVLANYPTLSGETRARAQTFLMSRPASALGLLQIVDQGKIRPQDIPLDQLRRVILYDNPEIKKLVVKHWGQVAAPAPGARVARINSVLHLLGQAKGDATAGKALFQKHCGTCHTLFGEGAKIGPDLTSVDRRDRSFLVTSMVDPSAIIRPEFIAHTVTTNDGRVLHGLILDRSEGAITLVDSKTDRTVLSQSKIESMEPSPVSLMPESILDPLDDQQIRDLVSYIQSDSTGAPTANTTPLARAKRPAEKSIDQEQPLKVCLVSGSLEYDSDDSLARFQEFLEKNYRVKCSRAFRKTDNDLPGLENLKTCDVMLLFTRRLTINGEQLEQVKKYCQAGKPIVGVRTTSHAFQNWLILDKEVLGGNYQGHYGTGPAVQVEIEKQAKEHLILAGVKPFQSAGSLYKNTGLAKSAEVLLTGAIPGHTEPVGWTHTNHGGRVFYTSLGHPKDFADDNFKQLLVNALFWTADRPVEKRK